MTNQNPPNHLHSTFGTTTSAPTKTETPAPTKTETPVPTKTETPVPTATLEVTKKPTVVVQKTPEPTKAPVNSDGVFSNKDLTLRVNNSVCEVVHYTKPCKSVFYSISILVKDMKGKNIENFKVHKHGNTSFRSPAKGKYVLHVNVEYTDYSNSCSVKCQPLEFTV